MGVTEAGPLVEAEAAENGSAAANTVEPRSHSKSSKDPYAFARTIVLRRLTLAPRSRAELRKSLCDRDVSVDVQEEVLDRFTELGLIDDVALADSFVAHKTENGRGRRAIAYKLRARGISDDIIESALSDVTDEDELVHARSLIERRWPRTAHLERAVRIRRLTGMLSRRGYAGHIVSAAIRQVEDREKEMDASTLNVGFEE